jgi:hypothetical protein
MVIHAQTAGDEQAANAQLLAVALRDVSAQEEDFEIYQDLVDDGHPPAQDGGGTHDS